MLPVKDRLALVHILVSIRHVIRRPVISMHPTMC